MKLSLAYYGDPILRKKAERISEINDDIRQLVADMVETMKAEDGIGLAAPQVHRSIALFMICVSIEGPNDTWIPGTLHVFLNPKILWVSDEAWEHYEGCLSIPKLHGKVIRPIKVRVEYTDMEGHRLTKEFSGLEASAVLHENDHINGVLYIDRMNRKDRQEIEPRLREIKKKFYKKA